jgi:hypothetical protein
MATYTYNPANIMGDGVDAMRFQLGDTLVASGADTAFLSDEEINAVISHFKSWSVARYRLIEAVCHRLSFEVDVRNDGTAYSLNQRAQRWFVMLEEAKKELPCMPSSGAVAASMQGSDGGHYFNAGMLANPYAEGERR